MEYIIHICILAAIVSIAAIGVNLLVGYTGLLSVGQALYSGVGAYTVAMLQLYRGWNFFAAALCGVAVAMGIACVVGLVLSKFAEDYYTLVTVGFNIIFFSVLMSWSSFTRGSLGVPGIHRPHIPFIDFTINFNFLIFSLLILGFACVVAHFLTTSSFGRVLAAVREDQKAIQVFGYKVFSYKLAIYIVSAALAAISGTLVAAYLTYIDPATFTVLESITTLSAVILGGLANFRASILGSVLLVVLPEALRFIGLPPEIAGQMRNLLYGLLLILLMLYKPEGLMGKYKF